MKNLKTYEGFIDRLNPMNYKFDNPGDDHCEVSKKEFI